MSTPPYKIRADYTHELLKSTPPYDIGATEISQYIRYNSCDRRLRLSFNDKEAAKETVPFAEELFNPIDPVLQQKGAERENEWANQIESQGFRNLNKTHQDIGTSVTTRNGSKQAEKIPWTEFCQTVSSLSKGEKVFAREVEISGKIGAFSVDGRMDFAIVTWNNGSPTLRIVETKSSRKERTNQRIQVAIYETLIEEKLSTPIQLDGGDMQIEREDIKCIVGRLDEETNQPQDILGLPSIDLQQEKEDIQNLLKVGGHVQAVVVTDKSNLDDLDYQLGSKCDQCVFDVHCFGESGRNRRLELIGLGPSEISELRKAGPSSGGIKDIDDLATLDISSQTAEDIRQSDNIREDLTKLKRKADARRQTLPGGSSSGYEVQNTHTDSESMLPEHRIEGEQIIRVYLDVNYDYVEDRVVSLAAHVTNSDWHISTDFKDVSESSSSTADFKPDTELKEVDPESSASGQDRRRRSYSIENDNPIVEFVPTEWTGTQATDDGYESSMIATFIRKVKRQINQITSQDEAFLHFYIWSDTEMEHLVDACARSNSNLLGDLRELLGSKEPTEQLIYSTLRNEIDRRYSLGWTGRGLIVASDLTWFGQNYHWVRDVNGSSVSLDNIFFQNLFDFKSERYLDQDNQWTTEDDLEGQENEFELRSRFFDSLPVPYMYSLWGSLPKPQDCSSDKDRVKQAVDRFHRVDDDTLEAYLGARTHALRWMEERCKHKNPDITKDHVELPQIPSRERTVDETAQVAQDFLLIDHHIARSEWLNNRVEPLEHQASLGEAFVIDDALVREGNKLRLQMDFSDVDVTKQEFRARTGLDEDSFVHLCAAPNDVTQGPSINMLTNKAYVGPIDDINWSNGHIDLKVIPTANLTSAFVMESRIVPEDVVFLSEDFNDQPGKFMLVESASKFTSRRAYDRLESGSGTHSHNWFDTTGPVLPDGPDINTYNRAAADYVAKTFEVAPPNTLKKSQADAAIQGIDSKVQLLLGPPGTGKTTTTAIAALERILHGRNTGDVVLIVGSTHRAVNELLNRIESYESEFRRYTEQSPGPNLDPVHCVKVVSDESQSDGLNSDVEVKEYKGNSRDFKSKRSDGILVLGGTTSSIIAEIEDLSDNTTWGQRDGPYLADEMIVDEASMMTYPHFLAVSSLVKPDARIMLAGDNRQLSPIVAHEWDEEKRPSIQKYEPHMSAFETIQSIKKNHRISDDQVQINKLDYTFRLEPILQSMIRPIYMSLENVELKGATNDLPFKPSGNKDTIPSIWEPETGLFLIRHDENRSRVSNKTEVELVDRILDSIPSDTDDDSVAVITPHTSQRAQLQQRLEEKYSGPINVVDTVGRLQGGESETVIISATASDKSAISNNEEFLLDLNRANVAFSRAEKRLIVICSKTLMDYVPPEVEQYKSSMLWKTLRRICSDSIGSIQLPNAEAEVLAPDESVEEVKEVLRNT